MRIDAVRFCRRERHEYWPVVETTAAHSRLPNSVRVTDVANEAVSPLPEQLHHRIELEITPQISGLHPMPSRRLQRVRQQTHQSRNIAECYTDSARGGETSGVSEHVDNTRRGRIAMFTSRTRFMAIPWESPLGPLHHALKTFSLFGAGSIRMLFVRPD
ncbi:MAG: hypothetical protein JXA69_12290 [Phycisphaerae bacterium]|nr:hypothetical protein [Phycisphaerae bacterium]